MFARILIGVAVLGLAAMAVLNQYRPRRSQGLEARPPPKPKAPSIEDVRWASIEDRGRALRSEHLGGRFDALKPLSTPKRRPKEEDWLAQHAEPGQSLVEWRAADPIRVSETRRVVYLQPVGKLTSEEAKVIALTADYVARFFGVPVKMLPAWKESGLWNPTRRHNPWTGETQLYTGDVLERLVSNRPDDALAYLALTSEDLFPGSNWNFVFGMASYTDRVGVWSTHRFGDPTESAEAKRLFVRRTLATATHELLHVVGISHCVAWECLANGINHQEEADAAPLEVCPLDLAKLVEATGVEPAIRYDRLIEFWRDRDPDVYAELSSAREVFAGTAAR